MKRISPLMIVFVTVILCNNTNAQLSKQYSDTANKFYNQNKLDSAVKYYTKAIDELKKDSAVTNIYAKICDTLGLSFYGLAQYDDAEKFYIEAKQVREKLLGKEHPDYIVSCNTIAGFYMELGQFEKAEPLLLDIKQIQEKISGKESPDYAASCNRLAVLYMNMGEYIKAEPLYFEAKHIREKVLGKENAQYAGTCHNLASMYWRWGKYEKAEPLYLEAKQVFEKINGKVNSSYARSCNALAILYRSMGRYEKAELLYLEAKQIRENIFGKAHPEYASSCEGLAILYTHKGEYEKAEVLYVEVKKIRENVFGMEHPEYAAACNNFAAFYYFIGQYEKAELLYLEAKKVQEKLFGKGHPAYATSCNNLALLYYDMGQLNKSEPLYLEAMQIQEKVFGKQHPDYAQSCANIAGLCYDMGEYEKAQKYLLEAKQIFEKGLGNKHPDYASACNNLAHLYLLIGQYEKAKPLYLEARQIFEKVLGKYHPDYGFSCSDLAVLYWQLHLPSWAEKEFKEAYSVNVFNLHSIFQFSNEKEKVAFIKNKSGENEKAYSFYLSEKVKPVHPYSLSLFQRNLILSSSQVLKREILSSNDTTLMNRYNEWVDLKKYLSILYSKTIDERKEEVKKTEDKADNLEKELTRLSFGFKKQQEKVSWSDVKSKLQINEASIEFISFRYFNGKRWTDSTNYIALVLRKDKPEPVLVQLFEKKQLDLLLNSVQNLATDKRINSLYSGNKSLYNLVWKPLEEYLNGITKIYFASAGNLFKISFAALPVNDKQMLGDKYQLIQLNTTAAISANTQSVLTASDKIQLYGGVRYDADSITLKQAVASYKLNSKHSGSLPNDLERGAGFQYLPGTQRETEDIKKQAGNINTSVTFLSGINATEESVKALTGKNSPSVLHIATHGFFFPDPRENKKNDVQRMFETSGKVFKQSDNPLFRSGLLFAGANNAWNGKPIEGIEDGILTSYEVSNMYLPNTKLVVLSACETALGDIQGSEGVYGLQRAFKMAGVQNMVMSLWKVPDNETAEFMQLFYKNLFAKQTISNAFYNAQQVMKNKYRTEPYKWAAWVLVK